MAATVNSLAYYEEYKMETISLDFAIFVGHRRKWWKGQNDSNKSFYLYITSHSTSLGTERKHFLIACMFLHSTQMIEGETDGLKGEIPCVPGQRIVR